MTPDADIDGLVRRVAELLPKVTPGPWAVESCGEKGDGSYMVGVVFDPVGDPECKHQLSGELPDCDDDGDFIEYYRDEIIADCDFHNRNPGYDSELIALAPTMAVALLEAAALIEALRKEREDLLTRAQTQHSRILTSNHQYLARASAAEQKLAKIAEIAVPPDDLGSDWHSEAIMLGEKLDRIAALAGEKK